MQLSHRRNAVPPRSRIGPLPAGAPAGAAAAAAGGRPLGPSAAVRHPVVTPINPSLLAVAHGPTEGPTVRDSASAHYVSPPPAGHLSRPRSVG